LMVEYNFWNPTGKLKWQSEEKFETGGEGRKFEIRNKKRRKSETGRV